MKDLTKIAKEITHSGKFHTDDVMATAFLRFFNSSLVVERVKEYDGEPEEDEIVYDIGLGTFDHHQTERRLDDNNHPYCAFGFLLEAYGREYLTGNGFVNVGLAFKTFKEKYVYKMD